MKYLLLIVMVILIVSSAIASGDNQTVVDSINGSISNTSEHQPVMSWNGSLSNGTARQDLAQDTPTPKPEDLPIMEITAIGLGVLTIASIAAKWLRRIRKKIPITSKLRQRFNKYNIKRLIINRAITLLTLIFNIVK